MRFIFKGLIWLGTEITGGPTGTYGKETSGSTRGGEFVYTVERVFAFKEGFCCMEFSVIVQQEVDKIYSQFLMDLSVINLYYIR
jgi:hypothetical protein